MRNRSQRLVLFLVLMLTSAVSLVVAAHSNQKIVPAQDTSRADVKLGEKFVPPPAPPAQSLAAAPLNDNCANAINIASCPFTNTQNTAMSTTEAGEPAPCGAIAATIWYTLPASAIRRNVTVNTCASSPLDTVLAAYKVTGADCAFAGFVNVACNDDFCGDGFQSTIAFTADAGAAYKIQAGGFAGSTGSLTINVACADILCPDIVIHGTLGSNDQTYPGPRSSGLQTGRLNRNGLASTCATPKSCLIFTAVGDRAFDAYTISNQSGQNVCVSVNLTETAGQTCNLQSNAYLASFNPASICTNYLADPGLSTGVPPTPTNMSFIVPTGQSLIVVVHTTNPGETGCTYTLTVQGNLCRGCTSITCLQDNTNPGNVVIFNANTGDYIFCCNGVFVASGAGTLTTRGCIGTIDDFKGTRRVHIEWDLSAFNNTGRGTAIVQVGNNTRCQITDTNMSNNMCNCSTAPPGPAGALEK